MKKHIGGGGTMQVKPLRKVVEWRRLSDQVVHVRLSCGHLRELHTSSKRERRWMRCGTCEPNVQLALFDA